MKKDELLRPQIKINAPLANRGKPGGRSQIGCYGLVFLITLEWSNLFFLEIRFSFQTPIKVPDINFFLTREGNLKEVFLGSNKHKSPLRGY